MWGTWGTLPFLKGGPGGLFSPPFSQGGPGGIFMLPFNKNLKPLARDLRKNLTDEGRDRFLNGLGFRVIRFSNSDVFNNIEGVVKEIYNHL